MENWVDAQPFGKVSGKHARCTIISVFPFRGDLWLNRSNGSVTARSHDLDILQLILVKVVPDYGLRTLGAHLWPHGLHLWLHGFRKYALEVFNTRILLWSMLSFQAILLKFHWFENLFLATLQVCGLSSRLYHIFWRAMRLGHEAHGTRDTLFNFSFHSILFHRIIWIEAGIWRIRQKTPIVILQLGLVEAVLYHVRLPYPVEVV